MEWAEKGKSVLYAVSSLGLMVSVDLVEHTNNIAIL